jgi:hypothetical protein
VNSLLNQLSAAVYQQQQSFKNTHDTWDFVNSRVEKGSDESDLPSSPSTPRNKSSIPAALVHETPHHLMLPPFEPEDNLTAKNAISVDNLAAHLTITPPHLNTIDLNYTSKMFARLGIEDTTREDRERNHSRFVPCVVLVGISPGVHFS